MMKILHGERGTGKSIKCIEYAWATNGVIVCVNHARKQFLHKLAKDWDMEDVEIICVDEMPYKLCGNHKPLIIDDLEDILSILLRTDTIALATTSCDIRELPDWKKDVEK